MTEIRILTAGESHGQGLAGIIEGMPAGVPVDKDQINHQLARRQQGYGRGGRMKIESDQAEILSGIRFGKTLGSPIAILVFNRDWTNWKKRMDPWTGEDPEPVTVPRPGHADLPGAIKYGHSDLRNILERASARETAMRVAIGAVFRQFLGLFGIWFGGHVIQIHQAKTGHTFRRLGDQPPDIACREIRRIVTQADASPVRCGDPDAEKAMMGTIDAAREKGDSVGGVFELAALEVPPGIGSHVMWDRRLDACIAADIMSIPAIKGVEIGAGVEAAAGWGSEIHDPIVKKKGRYPGFASNRAGGMEGGISNGDPVIVRAAMKPIPTLTVPLPSVDMSTGKSVNAHKERSDVCAVPAACVVGEAMLAISIGKNFMETFGGDSLDQIRKRMEESGHGSD